MSSITISNLDQETEERLRKRAARHGLSLEEELRSILKLAVASDVQVKPIDLGETIRQRFAGLGGVELPTVIREPIRESFLTQSNDPA